MPIDVGNLIRCRRPRVLECIRAAILRQHVAIAHGLVECVTRALHVLRLPRVAVYAAYEELAHLLAFGRHDRYAATHRLQVHLAERLGNRRVHEVIGRSICGRELFALQETDEMGLVGRK